MHCTNCGAQLVEGANFCSNCGAAPNTKGSAASPAPAAASVSVGGYAVSQLIAAVATVMLAIFLVCNWIGIKGFGLPTLFEGVFTMNNIGEIFDVSAAALPILAIIFTGIGLLFALVVLCAVVFTKNSKLVFVALRIFCGAIILVFLFVMTYMFVCNGYIKKEAGELHTVRVVLSFGAYFSVAVALLMEVVIGKLKSI